jgi:DUF1707 SHOCT-like domain
MRPVSETGPVLRASDDDRERVVRALGDHAAAGRLSPEELDERVDAAYAARTQPELDALLADLPAAPGPPAPDPERELARRRLAHHAGAAVIAIVACIGIWAAAGAEGSFWPIWVILVAALGVGREAWRTLGPGASMSDEELGDLRRRALERRRRL